MDHTKGEKSNQAVERFAGEFNCAQSVFSAFAEELGLSTDMALKLSNPFGAGIAYMQETCGAISGALMAIGLKYGKGEKESDEDKQMAYDIARYFISEFRKKHLHITCRQLLDNYDMSIPEDMEEIQRKDLFHLRCATQVKDAVEITQMIFDKIRK